MLGMGCEGARATTAAPPRGLEGVDGAEARAPRDCGASTAPRCAASCASTPEVASPWPPLAAGCHDPGARSAAHGGCGLGGATKEAAPYHTGRSWRSREEQAGLPSHAARPPPRCVSVLGPRALLCGEPPPRAPTLEARRPGEAGCPGAARATHAMLAATKGASCASRMPLGEGGVVQQTWRARGVAAKVARAWWLPACCNGIGVQPQWPSGGECHLAAKPADACSNAAPALGEVPPSPRAPIGGEHQRAAKPADARSSAAPGLGEAARRGEPS